MTDAYDKAFRLLERAKDLPFGAAQVALLEEAVQLADATGEVEMAYGMRQELMEAASFANRPDTMLVAFSWCVAQFDKNPDDFESDDLLWKYKWVVDQGSKFPEISKKKLEDLLADMDRRYTEVGSTMYPVALCRRNLRVALGDRPGARAAHVEFRKTRRDWLSDCIACVAHLDCEFYIFEQQWEKALKAAQPVLEGTMSCAEQPHLILSAVLLPLVRLKKFDLAKECQRRGYRLVGSVSHFVNQHAQQLRFATLMGDLSGGKRLLERHLPTALKSVTADDRFQFLLAARLWTDGVLKRGKQTVKLRLPDELPAADADGKSEVATLGSWFSAQALNIALRFDSRNGTTEFQRQIDALPELLEFAVE